MNPRGNRKINHAIHVAAICQLRYDDEGRTYYERKIAEGKSSKEAIRALKRRISDRVFRVIVDDARRVELPAEHKWAREDNQERHEIQRDRPHILNSRLFGSVTSRTRHTDPTTSLRPPVKRVHLDAPRHAPEIAP